MDPDKLSIQMNIVVQLGLSIQVKNAKIIVNGKPANRAFTNSKWYQSTSLLSNIAKPNENVSPQ
jgi:hypothetical protein